MEELFETNKGFLPVIVSDDDKQDACDFAEEFCVELAEHKSRLTSNAEETAVARIIRDRLHNESDVKVRLEAYKAHPLAGRGSCLLLAGWYSVCFVVYLLSFAWTNIVGTIVALLSLVLFFAGIVVFGLLFLGEGGKLKNLLPKKVSYNVVSERSPSLCEKSKERTIIICAGHDNVYGAHVTDFDKFRKIVMILSMISFFMFVLFGVLRMALGIDSVAKMTSFLVVPIFSTIMGIAVLAFHFSLSPKCARDNGGISTSVALATFSYFAENPTLLPDDMRIVFASFGGENSAHGGSRAFVNIHPEYANAKVLAIGDILSGNFVVPQCDTLRGIKASQDVVNAIVKSGELQSIPVSVKDNSSVKGKLNCLHGFISNAFSKFNISSATILAKDYNASAEAVRREDIEKLFSLSVTAVSLLMENDSGR